MSIRIAFYGENSLSTFQSNTLTGYDSIYGCEPIYNGCVHQLERNCNYEKCNSSETNNCFLTDLLALSLITRFLLN